MRMRRGLGYLILALGMAACTSTETLLASRGHGGRSFVFAANYNRTYDASLETLAQERLKIIRRDKEKGYLVAGDTIRFLSGGGRVAIFLYRLDPLKTQVEIHSQPFVRFYLPTAYWAAQRRVSAIREGIREKIERKN